jgi:hypothetical protein
VSLAYSCCEIQVMKPGGNLSTSPPKFNPGEPTCECAVSRHAPCSAGVRHTRDPQNAVTAVTALRALDLRDDSPTIGPVRNPIF